jgi:hypothetical protein
MGAGVFVEGFGMIVGKNEIMFANVGVLARWGWSELLTNNAVALDRTKCKEQSRDHSEALP